MQKNKTVLKVMFVIPKTKYKNSNIGGNRVIDQQKSHWLRTYANTVWTEALKNQLGIVADEPKREDYIQDYQPSKQEILWKSEYDAQVKKVKEVEDELSTISGMSDDIKAAKRELRKHPDNEQLSTTIEHYQASLSMAKETVKYERKLLTKVRNEYKKASTKSVNRHANSEHKEYIKAKQALNESKLAFPGHVIMKIRSNIMTDHDFDAPNSWPSVKPIQDGGTDTGILWHDDNNNYIKRTEFYGGWKASKEAYIIEIIVESAEDVEDPFGKKIIMPDLLDDKTTTKKKKGKKKWN
jgi:hypothetical protein